MSILESLHAGLFGGKPDDDYDDDYTYSSASESTMGKTFVSDATTRRVDDDTTTAFTRATEITKYTARKAKNPGSNKAKAKKVKSAAETTVSRYDDGTTVCSATTRQTNSGHTTATRGTRYTSATRGTEYTSATRGTRYTTASRGTEYTSATRGTEYTSSSSLGSSTKYTRATSASGYTTAAATSVNEDNVGIASSYFTTKGSASSTQAPRKKKLEKVTEERDDDDDDEDTMMYTTATGITGGRTSYIGDDDDYYYNRDATVAANIYDTGSTVAEISAWWNGCLCLPRASDGCLPRAGFDEENNTNVGIATAANAHLQPNNGFMTVATPYSNDVMLLTYMHGSDDHTTGAYGYDCATPANKRSERNAALINKWLEMRKRMVANFNDTWVATKAKVATITPGDIVIPIDNTNVTRSKVKKKNVHIRGRATALVVGKVERKLCSC